MEGRIVLGVSLSRFPTGPGHGLHKLGDCKALVTPLKNCTPFSWNDVFLFSKFLNSILLRTFQGHLSFLRGYLTGYLTGYVTG